MLVDAQQELMNGKWEKYYMQTRLFDRIVVDLYDFIVDVLNACRCDQTEKSCFDFVAVIKSIQHK